MAIPLEFWDVTMGCKIRNDLAQHKLRLHLVGKKLLPLWQYFQPACLFVYRIDNYINSCSQLALSLYKCKPWEIPQDHKDSKQQPAVKDSKNQPVVKKRHSRHKKSRHNKVADEPDSHKRRRRHHSAHQTGAEPIKGHKRKGSKRSRLKE